jgi:hypothetical protein
MLRIILLAALFALTVSAWAVDVNTVINVIDCESSGRYNAIGDSGKSYGIAQFQRATFNQLKRAARIPELSYKNPIHQMRLMVWAIDHGYGNNWTCYRKLVKRHVPPIHMHQDAPPLTYVALPARRETSYDDLIDYN